MLQRAAIFVIVVFAVTGYRWFTKDKRLEQALHNSSQFSEINTAKAQQKPLLVSIEPPGCPWGAHAAAEIAKVQPKFAERYVFLEIKESMLVTSGNDPYNYLSAKCPQGLCLFNPTSGKVKGLDEMIIADDLERELVAFAAN